MIIIIIIIMRVGPTISALRRYLSSPMGRMKTLESLRGDDDEGNPSHASDGTPILSPASDDCPILYGDSNCFSFFLMYFEYLKVSQ